MAQRAPLLTLVSKNRWRLSKELVGARLPAPTLSKPNDLESRERVGASYGAACAGDISECRRITPESAAVRSLCDSAWRGGERGSLACSCQGPRLSYLAPIRVPRPQRFQLRVLALLTRDRVRDRPRRNDPPSPVPGLCAVVPSSRSDLRSSTLVRACASCRPACHTAATARQERGASIPAV
jgi:hypothetical protein